MGNHKRLLVASHEKGRHQVCQRMHHMPVKKKPAEQSKTTPVSNPIRHLRYSLHFNSHGLHCQTPRFRVLRHHTYDHRHLLESIYFYPLQRINQRREHSQTLRYLRTSTLRTSHTYNFRLRPPFHIHIFQRTLPYSGNHPEHQHGLPPPNRRTIGAYQSTIRTIPPHLH